MNQLLVTLIIILLPGIIATVICDKIAVHSKWNSFKFSLYSFVLGASSYVTLQVGYLAYEIARQRGWPAEIQYLEIWSAATSTTPTIPLHEVSLAVLAALPVALLSAWLVNHKIFNKLAKRVGVTSKYGDENLYSYYLNAKEIDWVYIRDIDRNITYQGRVVYYSENDRVHELVLSEVTVFRYEDSSELYSVPTLYLCKATGGFVIEAVPSDLLGETDGEEAVD